MSSKSSPSYRTSNVDHKLACQEAKATVVDQRVSVNFTLRAAAEPIVQLPAAMNKLISEGRLDDVDKITSLCKTIATDVDALTAERDLLDKEYLPKIENPPRKKGHISAYNAHCTIAGLQYISLNNRIQATAGKAAGDFEEILGKEFTDAQKETVPESSTAQ